MDIFLTNLTSSERTLAKYCKQKGYDSPIYKVQSRDAARVGNVFRDKHYTISVTVNAIELAKEDGMSKRIARMKCATWGLQRLRVLELHQLVVGYKNAIPDLPKLMNMPSMLSVSASYIDQPQISAAVSHVLLPQIEEIHVQKSPTPERRESNASEVVILETLADFCSERSPSFVVERENAKNREATKNAFIKAEQAMERAKELQAKHEEYYNELNEIQSIISDAAKEISQIDVENN